MSPRKDQSLKNYQWIVTNPEIFSGKPIIRGTRFSVAFLLGCLAEGMTADEIEKTYGAFPKVCISEVLKFAEGLADKPLGPGDVAA